MITLEHIEGIASAPVTLRRWLERNPSIAQHIAAYHREYYDGHAEHWVYCDGEHEFEYMGCCVAHEPNVRDLISVLQTLRRRGG